MEKFEKIEVYVNFHDIEILEIKNIHTGQLLVNLYIFQGFKVSDGTGYPVYTNKNTVVIGHLSIETTSYGNAKKLCEKILDICL